MEEYTEKTLENFKEAKDEKNLEKFKISDDEKEIIEKIYEEAKMPTVLKDNQVECGQGELDIRKLNRPNRDQMIFRTGALNLTYLRQNFTALLDIEKLLMLILKKLGVENITQAIANLEIELSNEVKTNLDKRN